MHAFISIRIIVKLLCIINDLIILTPVIAKGYKSTFNLLQGALKALYEYFYNVLYKQTHTCHFN